MKYKKHLSEPWFSLIKIGVKSVEGRLNKGDFKEMVAGDEIIFYNDDQPFHREYKVIIESVKNYGTFNEYLIGETLKRALPGIERIKDGVEIYYQWYKKDESTYGVKAIRLKCV